MTVRPARPDEAAAITALAVESKQHWGYDEAFMAACLPELSWTPEQVAEQDVLVWAERDRLLGTAARGGTAPDGGIWAVFVAPEAHGRGIGRALAEALLARAEADGFRSLTIAADPNAEGFYRAVGAQRVGDVPSDLLPGRVLPLLRFALAEERSATVPGGALRIRLRGPADGPRLLLLHGGPGLSDSYLDGLVDEFADDHRVATYAQRGVAPSTAGAPYDLPVQAADVVAVLEELGWTDAVALGHSFGGHLLLHVLADRPERLRAAVVLDPLGGVGDGGGAEFGQELLRRLSADDRVRLERPGMTDAEQLEILWPAYFPPDAPAPAYREIPVFPEAAEAGFAAIFAALPTLAPRLRGVTTPTRFVVGEGSPMPESASADTAALLGARVVRVPGGHFPWLQHPGAVRAAVDAFLQDLADGGTAS